MEKAPRKKAKKPMKKGTVLFLLLCFAAAVGAGVSFLQPQSVELPITNEKETIFLLHRPAEEIVSVEISPREGTAYCLVQEMGSFHLQDQPETPLREDGIEDLLVTLTELPVEAVLTTHFSWETHVALADFGLSPAVTEVTVTYADGEKVKFMVGDAAPDEEKPQRYCMVSGDDRLLTILSADAQPLLREKAYLRAFDQPQLDGSLLDRIEVTGDITWSLHYTPSGWQMDAPISYPLSTVRTDALLSKIESMAFDTCLGEAEQMDLADFDLDEPALTVTLTQATTVITGETTEGETISLPVPETTYTLLIGAETGKSGVYVLWDGLVFRASNFRLGFWKEIRPMDYILQTPVNFLVNDLKKLTFTYGGQTSAYEVQMVESITENNQIATDEYGQVLYDCAVRRAGEKEDMDAEAFLSWYTQLAQLSGDGKLPDGFELSGEPRAVITLENEHLTRTVAFYPYDALHDALAVDGVALYYIQKTRLDDVGRAP